VAESEKPSGRQEGGEPITLVGVTKKYPGTERAAVDAINLEIKAGEFVCLVGPSGCGKTTTMRMINRLIEPTSGQILIGDDNILKLDVETLRRRIGYVIQQVGLFPHMTIAHNVSLVPRMLKWPESQVKERVHDMLALVGLDPGQFAKRYPRQLSGGQQQRVGVARALAADPPIMLMDEPFGAVDPITRVRLQDEFLSLQRELKKTIVFVTHDFDEAVKMSDRIVILREGSHIAQFDTPAAILANPADDFVGGFVGRGANLKQLDLQPLSVQDLAPTSATTPNGMPTVSITESLSDALDLMLGTGKDEIHVVDGNRVVGSVNMDVIMREIHQAQSSKRPVQQ
jgi:osmoprotectant transport system ATP-binding protein